MAYCKYFLEGVKQINFTEEGSSKAIRKIVLTSAYQELKKAETELSQLIASLPEQIEGNPDAQQQVALFREKQQQHLNLVKQQMQEIKTEFQDIDSENQIQIDNSRFLTDFSSKFRNLSHLASTLSDAPEAIKKLQTQLYVTVLSQLDKAEQEKQLSTLSNSDIQNILKQAIATYENKESTEELKHQCKHLVQMVIFEQIRRDCEKVQGSQQVSHEQYQQFLTTLNAKLPEVDSSTIIDNLSEYQNTQGQSIGDLLFDVQSKLKIQEDKKWNNDKIKSAQQEKDLLHKLRFGQEDRREYIKKRQDNMARDLFWARNIRDIELFTKSQESDALFQRFAEQRYIRDNQKNKFQMPHGKPNNLLTNIKTIDIKVLQKLESAFANVKKRRIGEKGKEKPLFPSGDKIQTWEKKYNGIVKNIIKEELEKATVPVVTQKNGMITIEFFHFNSDNNSLETILDKIIEGGGFGADAATMVQYLAKHAPQFFQENIKHYSFTGKSLSEIKTMIEKKPNIPQNDLLNELGRIEHEVNTKEQIKIDKLNLSTSDELLLRKLLELKVISEDPSLKNKINLQQEPLSAVFKNIAAGKYEDALKTAGISAAVDKAYENLAKIEDEQHSIIQKAKTISTSSKERQEKLTQLESLFREIPPDADKISKIFIEEYQSMQGTLGETINIEVMKKDITAMAKDMVRLIERTQKGEPVLQPQETDAYFDAIKQMAEQIGEENLSNFQFKIPHSKSGEIKIQLTDKEGKTQEITVNLKTELPYSLIKPPGESEFIFSYGGSRGVIAPFAGFEAVSTSPKAKRFFTHSRLLGVGQYGSVKEVEGLLTGLNQVIKKGNVPKDDPIYSEEQRKELLTRPITSREDPLYRIECDVNRARSNAEQTSNKAGVVGTQFWVSNASHKENRPVHQQYQILTERAKGDTLADTANRELNRYTKGDALYHDPIKRHAPENNELNQFKEMLSLSQALVERAQHFESLGFAHNDIKPENFLYKRNPDGSYAVRYIDWATGGFEQKYPGSTSDLKEIFAELFGADLTELTINDTMCSDSQGRFVKKGEDNVLTFGVNPKLEILHGSRNGTIPYISPIVLGEKREKHSVAAGVHDSKLDTHLSTGVPTLDNYALTAMTFGICSRQAYFELVKGRAVIDYEVPGVLEKDGQDPLGLKIVNVEEFNKFFACGKNVSEDDIKNGAVYTDPSAVMFIPSNQREGEPLHLFRHLLDLKRQLSEKKPKANSPEEKIVQDIEGILNKVQESIANGKGLTKQELQEQFALAQTCIKNFEKLNDQEYQKMLQQTEIFQSVIKKYDSEKEITADSLTEKVDNSVSELVVLCTYASSKEEQKLALTILNKAFDEKQLNDKIINKSAPYSFLFKECIAKGQSDILISLLDKIKNHNDGFINIVHEQGLLHYAFELGQNEVASALIRALKKAGADDKAIFKLMMQEYGPGKTQLHTAPHIKWATNCFHIAIRNDNAEQLKAILDLLPKGTENDEKINQALHLCALLGNKRLFNQILTRYNEVNPENKITPEKIINMTSLPDGTSPYHLFMRDEATLDIIESTGLDKKQVSAKKFLLSPAINTHAYPTLIAAEHGNFAGVKRMLKLGEDLQLSPQEWTDFFKQADEKGKTVLNYALEQKNFSFLNELIKNIQKKCGTDAEEVLVHLLSNPHPVNPLKNYLDSEKNEAQQFAIAKQLLDAVCLHFEEGKEKQQMARIAALLVNETWLLEKAQNKNNHQSLRDLLHNDALSIPFKRGLFAQLAKEAKEEQVSKKFYQGLLNEISPPQEEKTQEATILPDKVWHEVHRQTDIHAFLNALSKEMNQKLQSQVEEHRLQLESIQTKLNSAEQEKETLKQQFQELQEKQQKEAEKFKLELEKAQNQGTEAIQEAKKTISNAITQHQSEIEQLKTQLNSKMQEVESLKQQLSSQTEPVKSSAPSKEQKIHETLDKITQKITTDLTRRRKIFLSNRLEKVEKIKAAFGELENSDKETLLKLKLDGKDIKSILKENKDLKLSKKAIKFLQEISKSRSLLPIGDVKSFQDFKSAIKEIKDDPGLNQLGVFDINSKK